MTRPLPRRLAAATAAGLLALTLAACGNESDNDDDATDDTGSQTSESPEETPGETSTPSESAGESASASAEPTEGGSESAGELPEWAPEIVTDADGGVTALDFTDVPEPSGQLEVATVVEGDGPPVEAGQTLTVDYFGAVYQADAQFDDSYSRGQPATFPIGVGQLIPGWDQGIPGTPVGSRIIMMIPPDLAYGPEGRPPTIPGDSTLYFVIDVINAS